MLNYNFLDDVLRHLVGPGAGSLLAQESHRQFVPGPGSTWLYVFLSSSFCCFSRSLVAACRPANHISAFPEPEQLFLHAMPGWSWQGRVRHPLLQIRPSHCPSALPEIAHLATGCNSQGCAPFDSFQTCAECNKPYGSVPQSIGTTDSPDVGWKPLRVQVGCPDPTELQSQKIIRNSGSYLTLFLSRQGASHPS